MSLNVDVTATEQADVLVLVGRAGFAAAVRPSLASQLGWLAEVLLRPATETVGLLGTGAQDGHFDFHTTPELCNGS